MPDIVCPSGLAGTIRNIKAKEAQLLADKSKLKSGESINGVLAGCWLTTTEHGVYKTTMPNGIDWKRALSCDRFYALIKVRAATYGDLYAFKFRCVNERCKLHNRAQEWEINLNQLPVKQLPEASRAHLLAHGNRFETTMRDGRALYFKLQDGAGEVEAYNALQESQGDMLVAAMRSRVVGVDGVEWSNPAKRDEFLGDLDMPELLHLVDKFDEQDGGVDTTIGVRCVSCEEEQQIMLPFDADFFMPKKRKPAPSTS